MCSGLTVINPNYHNPIEIPRLTELFICLFSQSHTSLYLLSIVKKFLKINNEHKINKFHHFIYSFFSKLMGTRNLIILDIYL